MGTVVLRDGWDDDVARRARAHLRGPPRRRQRPPRRVRPRDARTSSASRKCPRTPRRRDARRGSRSRLAGRRDDRSRSGRARARATSRRSRTRAPPRSRGRPCRSPENWPARRGRSLGRGRRRRAPRSARQPTASDKGGGGRAGASSQIRVLQSLRCHLGHIDTPPGERRGRVAQHRPCKAGSDRLLIRPR